MLFILRWYCRIYFVIQSPLNCDLAQKRMKANLWGRPIFRCWGAVYWLALVWGHNPPRLNAGRAVRFWGYFPQSWFVYEISKRLLYHRNIQWILFYLSITSSKSLSFLRHGRTPVVPGCTTPAKESLEGLLHRLWSTFKKEISPVSWT
jgi:hypothetical protein